MIVQYEEQYILDKIEEFKTLKMAEVLTQLSMMHGFNYRVRYIAPRVIEYEYPFYDISGELIF